MMDPEKFKHDSSRYKRPMQKYRCGRTAIWGKPCEFGQNTAGGALGMRYQSPLDEAWILRAGSMHGLAHGR